MLADAMAPFTVEQFFGVFAAYNTAVVAIEGTVDMATGTIAVEGRALEPVRARARVNALVAA